MRLIARIIKWPFKVIFSRTSLAILSVALQILVILTAFEFFSDYIVWIFGGVTILSLFVVVYILNSKQNPAYKIAWIIPILLFPLFGVLVYLFVHTQAGTRIINKKLKLIRNDTQQYLRQNEEVMALLENTDKHTANFITYMNQYCGFPIFTDTEVSYFPLGENMYEDLLEELEKAQKYIFIEYFIIERGIMWDSILEVLKRKAEQGVEVRVLYDGMCSIIRLPKNYPSKLRKMGIKCKVFSPIRPFISTEQNNRDHRKILVIDGVVGYNGGINLADEYINKKERFGHWKDTAVKVKGEAVQNFTMMFLEMWNVSGKKQEDYEKYVTREEKQSYSTQKGYVLPYADNPLDDIEVGRRVYLEILNSAQKYVHIITPYLILDNEMLTTLIYTVQRGVDVKIIMPHIPDKKMVYYLGRSYYKDLIESGVQIYEYTPGFTHAKMFISDDIKAVVGTINLDYRSLYLHFECATYIYKNDIIPEIEKDYQETLEKCQLITLQDVEKYNFAKKYIGKVLRFFAPLM